MSLLIVKNLGRCVSPKLLSAQTVKALPQTQVVAGITSANGKPRQRPYKTFDYRKKEFTFFHQPFDRTHKRYDENSRVVIIDGPIASGKNEFAKKLAKELDFLYVPQPNPKDLHNIGYGLSLTDLDELLPPKYRIYDSDAFLKDDKPKVADGGGRVGQLQFEYFASRLYTYNDALLHMLSTGQGVVCVRSPWSDQVFAKALYDNGYMTKKGYTWYKKSILFNHLCDFPRPHLFIYLDATVDETLANIKGRNRELEASSKIFSGDFLQSIENEYKDVVLPTLNEHSELLVYPSIRDITEHEVQLMVEDIEDLGPITHSGYSDDPFLGDWRTLTDEELAAKRRDYQNLTLVDKVKTHALPLDCPEFSNDANWAREREKLYAYEPGWMYHAGFDPQLSPMMNVLMDKNNLPEPEERRQFWVPAA